jgi:hypothetical protein
MWMEFECEASLVAKTAETRQHFFIFSVWSSPGLSSGETDDKLFWFF